MVSSSRSRAFLGELTGFQHSLANVRIDIASTLFGRLPEFSEMENIRWFTVIFALFGQPL